MTHRTEKIKKIFSEVGPTYDLVNRVLTFGLDVYWRRRAARRARGGRRWLDACSGTGDMARALVRVAPPETAVTALDFSLPMLRLAARKSRERPFRRVCAAFPRLPFPDATFDLVTLSFATRNINLDLSALRDSFREILRVLKPGGLFINLETSQPPIRFFRNLFRLYARTAVKPLGRAISGSRAGYAYLSSTVPRFYEAPVLARILAESGFVGVSFEFLFLGAAAIHAAFKEEERPMPGRRCSATSFTCVPRGEE